MNRAGTVLVVNAKGVLTCVSVHIAEGPAGGLSVSPERISHLTAGHLMRRDICPIEGLPVLCCTQAFWGSLPVERTHLASPGACSAQERELRQAHGDALPVRIPGATPSRMAPALPLGKPR